MVSLYKLDEEIKKMEERLESWHKRRPSYNELLDIQREFHDIRMDMEERRAQYHYGGLTGAYPFHPPYLKLKSFSSRDESGMSYVIG